MWGELHVECPKQCPSVLTQSCKCQALGVEVSVSNVLTDLALVVNEMLKIIVLSGLTCL